MPLQLTGLLACCTSQEKQLTERGPRGLTPDDVLYTNVKYYGIKTFPAPVTKSLNKLKWLASCLLLEILIINMPGSLEASYRYMMHSGSLHQHTHTHFPPASFLHTTLLPLCISLLVFLLRFDFFHTPQDLTRATCITLNHQWGTQLHALPPTQSKICSVTIDQQNVVGLRSPFSLHSWLGRTQPCGPSASQDLVELHSTAAVTEGVLYLTSFHSSVQPTHLLNDTSNPASFWTEATISTIPCV